MEEFSNNPGNVSAKQAVLLKQCLARVPKALRSSFAMLVCKKLGVENNQESIHITERLYQFFKALDSEMN